MANQRVIVPKREIDGYDDFIHRFECFTVGFKFQQYAGVHTYYYFTGAYQAEGTYLVGAPELAPVSLSRDKFMIDMAKLNVDYPGDRSSLFSIFLLGTDVARKAIINTQYELIINFIEIDPSKKNALQIELRNQLWFKVLNLLRNNASHFDNLGKTLLKSERRFPKYITEDEVKWKNITITESMMGHTLRYNDFEVIELLEEASAYFEANKLIFQ